MRSLLGKLNWFRGFISNLAEKTYYLTNSLKISKNAIWKWTSQMEKEFNEIKNEIKEIKNLQIIDYNKRLVLRTDASNIGVGAVFMQENEDGELKAIEWASKKLTPTESRYTITEKEMLGVLFDIEKFSYEL